jgi:hypothetical protein
MKPRIQKPSQFYLTEPRNTRRLISANIDSIVGLVYPHKSHTMELIPHLGSALGIRSRKSYFLKNMKELAKKLRSPLHMRGDWE